MPMPGSGAFPRTLSDEWKYGVIGGVVSIPPTVATYAQTSSELSLASVFFGGLLAGYLAERETGRAHGVGVRAGLVGATPSLWLGSDVLVEAASLSGPSWFHAAGVVLTVLFVALAFWISAAVGGIGSLVGRWFASSDGERGRPAAEG